MPISRQPRYISFSVFKFKFWNLAGNVVKFKLTDVQTLTPANFLTFTSFQKNVGNVGINWKHFHKLSAKSGNYSLGKALKHLRIKYPKTNCKVKKHSFLKHFYSVQRRWKKHRFSVTIFSWRAPYKVFWNISYTTCCIIALHQRDQESILMSLKNLISGKKYFKEENA